MSEFTIALFIIGFTAIGYLLGKSGVPSCSRFR